MSAGKPEPKRLRVLRFFAAGGSATRRQATYEPPFDPSLHTTASQLEQIHGIRFRRHPEYVAGYGGVKTRWIRFSLSEAEQEKARQVLRAMDEKKPGGQAGLRSDTEPTTERPDAREQW